MLKSWRTGARDCNAVALISMRRLVASCCVSVLLGSSACAQTEDPSGEPVRTDSAGVSVVLNGPADRMLDWTFERILDLGGADEGPTAFFRVFPTSIGVDSLGNLYVLDAGNHRVSVFDRSGNHVRSFGREGDGPGELSFPSDMGVTPAGEAAVYDFNRGGLVLFDAAGAFKGTFPIPGPLQRQVALLGDGRIAAGVTRPTPSADSVDYLLLALDSDTVEIARIRRLDRHHPQQFSCGPLALPPYFEPRVVWAAAGNRLVLNHDAAYSVQVFDGNRLVAVWRRELPMIRSTLDLAAWEVAQGGDSLRIRLPFFECAIPAGEAARKIGYADIAPIIEKLAVAPDGGVWLRRRTDVPGVSRIDVFDARGTYVGTLPGESPFPALFRGPDEVVVVETDEWDVPHVVVYRIKG